MKYLVFDTETTGLPQRQSWSKYYPITDFSKYEKARIVSIAWSIYDDLKLIKSVYHVVKPTDFVIDDKSIATKINGITQKVAEEQGISLRDILTEFDQDTDEHTTLVAHNLDFDKHIILAEIAHLGDLDLVRKVLAMPEYCTMKKSVNIAKIKKSHAGGYKFPRLSELFYHFHGHEFQNAHNAQADVDACVKCYQKLTGLK